MRVDSRRQTICAFRTVWRLCGHRETIPKVEMCPRATESFVPCPTEARPAKVTRPSFSQSVAVDLGLIE